MRKITLALLSLTVSLLPLSAPIQAENSTKQEKAVHLEQFSQAELEQMLAPIALYPDSVLTHILIASTYPLEVIQANRWLEKNSSLAAADALSEVEDKEWDPSVKALVPFPRILERLNNDLDWTQKLGDAFLQNEEQVLKSIQSLRRKADQAGNLEKMSNMEITRENQNIIIQPTEPEVIYVPYYDTRVVYGNWHWAHYQPVYWDWSWHSHHNHHRSHYTPHHGVFSWHPSIHISNHFFYSAFNWHNHHVIVVDRHHYTSRRYQHRSHIVANSNARRWSHNPTHRRGVAYRSDQIRERYNSNRPSVSHTRVVRNSERAAITNREAGRTNTRTVNNTSTRNTAIDTRQERLRQQLNNNRNSNSTESEISTRGRSSRDNNVNVRANNSRSGENRNGSKKTANQNTRTIVERKDSSATRTENKNNQSNNRNSNNSTRNNSNDSERSRKNNSRKDDNSSSRKKSSNSSSVERRTSRSDRSSNSSRERKSSRSSRRDDR
jgi:hypothetical protein